MSILLLFEITSLYHNGFLLTILDNSTDFGYTVVNHRNRWSFPKSAEDEGRRRKLVRSSFLIWGFTMIYSIDRFTLGD